MEGTIRPSIRLTLEKEERFFGPGVADLLELAEEKGSIQGACSEMGMSYSKSWKIIKRAERGAWISTFKPPQWRYRRRKE